MAETDCQTDCEPRLREILVGVILGCMVLMAPFVVTGEGSISMKVSWVVITVVGVGAVHYFSYLESNQ